MNSARLRRRTPPPGGSRAVARRRRASPTRLIASLLAVLVLVVGVPALLVVSSRAGLGSSHPVPRLGSVDEIRAHVERGLSATELTPLALRALLSVAWLLWLALVVSALGSIAETFAGSRLGLPRFGAFGAAGAWIAAGFTTLSSLAPAGAFAGASEAAPFTLNRVYATADAAGYGTAAVDPAAVVPTGHARVLPGESAETFAERVLGDRQRWEEVWTLNRGEAVGPGAEVWSEAWNLVPGSVLRLPTPAPGDNTHTVAAGESYWTITEEALGDAADPAAVAAGTDRLLAVNAAGLGYDDPTRLHPGDVVVVDLAALSEPATAVAETSGVNAVDVDAEGSSVEAAESSDAGGNDVTYLEYVVQPGDSYWSIATQQAIGQHGADGASNAVVYELMIELRELNAPRLDHPSRDLLHPGDVVLMAAPVADVAPPAEPAPDVEVRAVIGAATADVETVVSGLVATTSDIVSGAEAVADGVERAVDEAAAVPATAPDVIVTVAPVSTTPPTAAPVPTTEPALLAAADDTGSDEGVRRTSPSPIGVGEAALLATGVLGLLGARRRRQLRAAEPPARVPVPFAAQVAIEQELRAIDAPERALRVDIALRAAAATLVAGPAQVAYVLSRPSGALTLRLTVAATMEAPWTASAGGIEWTLPADVAVEDLAPAARRVGAPCVALVQLGVTADGADVLVDLEGLRLLAVDGDPLPSDAIVRALAVGVASSELADVAHLVGVGIHDHELLAHHHAQLVPTIDDAARLARTLAGSTVGLERSTFAVRARRTGGEVWEPVVVVIASSAAQSAPAQLLETSLLPGVAVVAAGAVAGARWTLRAPTAAPGAGPDDAWVLEPSGLLLRPVGIDLATARTLGDLVVPDPLVPDALVPDQLVAFAPLVARRKSAPLVVVVDDDGDSVHAAEGIAPDDAIGDTPGHCERDGAGPSTELFDEPDDGDQSAEPWRALVRLLGPVDIVDRAGRPVTFERSKPLELLAWMATHRQHSTRAAARTALWLVGVRDATFANVVSEARRTMARRIVLDDGEEWIGRTMNDQLVLHPHLVTDADVVRAALASAEGCDARTARELLRPAVELVRGLPFAGSDYLWSDSEGFGANLVLLATTVAARYAEHALALDDIDGVFWATGKGLAVIAGQESLIALRMRAHAGRGDRSGVRVEWEAYERVVTSDPWSDGELSPKLVQLRRELLSVGA